MTRIQESTRKDAYIAVLRLKKAGVMQGRLDDGRYRYWCRVPAFADSGFACTKLKAEFIEFGVKIGGAGVQWQVGDCGDSPWRQSSRVSYRQLKPSGNA